MARTKSQATKTIPVRYTKLLGCRVTEELYDLFLAKAVKLGMKLEDYLRQEYMRIIADDDIRLGGSE